MNVGSILNDDSPPSESETRGKHQRAEVQVQSQRSSITNLLNDEKPKTAYSRPSPKATTASHDGDSRSATPRAPVWRSTKSPTPNAQSPPDNKSVKQLDEIERLQKLKLSKKPTRYQTPPIWAQEWIPKSQASNGRSAAPPPVFTETTLSEKRVFDNTSTVSVDLECSVTGVIPPPSITRTIAEWIYANFIEITDENRKYVELELKFGTIINKSTNQRLDINVSTECIYTDASRVYFEAGMHEVGFNELNKFLSDLEKTYQETIARGGEKTANKPKRKFNTLVTDVTDSIYHIKNRNEPPKTIRVSKDNNLKPPRYTGINKQRISDLYIHNPSSMYDLRLSLSLENPIAEDQVMGLIKKQSPNLVRIKQRTSYNHKPTATTFDLTRVATPREAKNTATGKKIVDNEKGFEVELEIDTMELFNGFDQFKSGQDSIRFEELVEIFVNNARVLNNRITQLAK